MIKIKLTLSIIFLIFVKVNSFAQIATLINNFKPAYASGDPSNYISNGEYIVSNLPQEEKKQGKRILALFKVLTGNQQDMPTVDFNNAMYDAGLSSLLVKNINADLSLITFKFGKYRSYLVFNQSNRSYRFSLKGSFKTATRSATNNFDGGIFGKACRIVTYTDTPYAYKIASVAEISSSY